MQTLFVVLAGVVLGPRDGFLAMLSYLALGAAGVPVFAGFSFGPAVLAGPTGGYLIAFPAAALLAGVLCRTLGNGSLAVLAGAAGGAVLILIMGTLHLSLITGLSPSAAISLAVMPFLLADLIKVLIA
ncbi:MAG: biotin transporter BioY, partial [Candidatus Krumholzibacteriota bacterium]|nr:biotin transporter BioY [Candidatus Krumholzibacteriota bacterium]